MKSLRSLPRRTSRAAVTFAVCAAVAAPIGFAPSAQAQTPGVSIVVPAYFTDKALWDKVSSTSAVSYIVAHPLEAPEAGKAFPVDADLNARINEARGKGKKVVIYVTGGYDKIDAPVVVNQISAVLKAYPQVDGVFIDQINYDQCAKYKTLIQGTDGVKARFPGKEVILNPGSVMLSCYEGLADGYVNLERPESAANAKDGIKGWLDAVNVPADVSAYSWMFKPEQKGKMWQMIHSVPKGGLPAAVDAALTRNATLLYITDDTLPNPYDQLPDGWDQLVARVNEYNSGKKAIPALAGVPVPGATSTSGTTATAAPTTAKPGATPGATVTSIVKITTTKKIVVKKTVVVKKPKKK